MATEMQDSLKKIISGIIEDEPETHKDYQDDNHLNIRRAIKEKAMRQEIDPVRHLVAAEDKIQEPQSNKSPKKERSYKRGKAKGSLAKGFNPEELRNTSKRKISFSTRATKKIRHYTDTEDSSSSESDYEVKLKEVENQYESSKNKDKETAGESSKDGENSKNGDDSNKPANEEQAVNLDIDDLPILIRSEDTGQLFEIEIIDEYKDDNKKPEAESIDGPLEALKQLSMISGLSVTKLDNEDQPVMEPVPSTSKDMNPGWQVLENEDIPLIPKPEKRLMKRVHLHSKFKRMGILPIANFNHPEIGEKSQDKTKEQKMNNATAKS